MSRRFKKASFSLHENMIAAIDEVVEKRGMSGPSELIRQLFQDYYENDFRKNFVGYHSGIDTVKDRNKRRGAKEKVEDFIASLEAADDESATVLLQRIGYIDLGENMEKGMEEAVITTPGGRMLRQSWNEGAYKKDVFNWVELLADVRKFLKSAKRE